MSLQILPLPLLSLVENLLRIFLSLVDMSHRPSQLLHRRQLPPRSQLPRKVSQRPLLIEAS